MSKSAIEGATRTNLFLVDPDDLVVIGLDTSAKSLHDHYLFDATVREPLDESLIASIMTHGIIQPITVQKDGDRILVVAGRRRVRHAREANVRLKKSGAPPVAVPCTSPRKGDDLSMMSVMATENIARKEKEFVWKAEIAKALSNSHLPHDEIARRIGCSEQYVGMLLEYNDLDPLVKDAVNAEEIAPTTAVKLAKLDRETQKKELVALKSERKGQNGKISAAAVTKRVSEAKGQEAIEVPSKRLLNKIVKHPEAKDILSADFLRALRWVTGDLGAANINGLTGIIKEIRS